MERILIAYATKTGTTRKCAELLAERLTKCRLADLSAEKPNPVDYDMVILGSAVRMGALHKKARVYLREYEEALRQKPAAYFISNLFVDQAADILRAGVPAELLEKAVCFDSFGGELDPAVLKGWDRLMAKMAAGAGLVKGPAGIRTERIDAFAQAIRDFWVD